MLHAKIIDIKKEKIKISKAKQFISSSKFGASIIFTGTVRDVNENKKVTGITYDSHDVLVIKSFEEIYKESDDKLHIKDKAVFIEHVKGYVGLGEVSSSSLQINLLSVTSAGNALTALDAIDTAIGTVTQGRGKLGAVHNRLARTISVSYTHLTLPTICSV